MGKHKPIYDPSTDCGDYVVVSGCHDLHVTGKKMQQKKYYRHTTRPGSLKEMSMEKMMAKWGGGEILRRAVRGMLPKNRLRDDRMARLKCASHSVLCSRRGSVGNADFLAGFEGQAHPYKENIVKFNGERRILEQPEVQTAFERPRQEGPQQ
jgi:large subunit ribosomal protein L13